MTKQDIVYGIGGDPSSLIVAGEEGAKALRKVDTAAKDVKKGLDSMSVTLAQYQQRLKSAMGATDGIAYSAKKSAATFQKDWDKAVSQVNRLKTELDPLYAASMRYQTALERLNLAMEKGVIGEDEHLRLLKLAETAYLDMGPAVTESAGKMGGFAGVIGNNRQAVQMFGYQIQDVAVQLAAGTRATTVFAQQGSQMLGMFGVWGAVAGAAVAVTLPLAGALFSAGEAAEKFSDTLSSLEEAVRLVDEASKNYTAQGLEELRKKYGEIDQGILSLIEHERQFALARVEATATEAVAALAAEYGALSINLGAVGDAAKGPTMAIYTMSQQLGLTVPQTRELVQALQDANSAKDNLGRAEALSRIAALMLQSTQRAGELTGQIVKAEASFRQLVNSVPGASWLGGMIAQAETLGGKLWSAVQAKAALANDPGQTTGNADWAKTDLGFTLPGKDLVYTPPKSSGGGGGGGGAKDSTPTDLERLQEQLLSEAEVQLAAFEKQQELLEQALAKKLLTQQEYNALMEAAQREHQEKMTGIDVWRYGDGLAQTEAFMGGMADALQTGNEKMQRIGKIFGAAEALVNSWRAFSQVLADQSLPFYAKIPSAIAVLSAGMNAVNAIKGGSSGAGATKAVAAVAQTSAAAAVPATVNISWQGGMTAESMGSLTKKLNAEFKQGYRLNIGFGA